MKHKFLLATNTPVIDYGLSVLIKKIVGKNADILIARTFQQLENELDNTAISMLILDLEVVKDENVLRFKRLCLQYPMVKMLALYEVENKFLFYELYKNGMLGILEKSASFSVMFKAVFKVFCGEIYIAGNLLADLLTNKYYYESAFDKLTPQERKIIELLMVGNTGTEICSMLLLHPSTVSTFKNKAFKKLRI